MDFQRLLLVIALALVTLMLYQAWQKDFGPHPINPTTVVATTSPGHAAAVQSDVPTAAISATPVAKSAAPAPSQALQSGRRIRVVTDNYVIELDTRGGDLRRADLRHYPVSVEEKNKPFRLMDDGSTDLFVAQSGLLPGNGTAAADTPDHHALFTADQDVYRMEPGEKTLLVKLHWSDGKGLTVTKTYTFHRGSYVIDVAYDVNNATAQPWSGHAYYQFQRERPAKAKHSYGSHSYTGGVVHSKQVHYEKISFDDLDKKPFEQNMTGGWAAMIQNYFLGAWIPPQNATDTFYSKALGEQRYLLGLMGPAVTVAPHQQGTLSARLYVGPKLQDHLDQVADGLALTVDYGRLTVLAQPIYWLLKHIYSIVGNWGWSIIILTLMIKLAFFKLSATSYKSMANMRKLQPRMKALKERFGDDRQAMNEATMKLYKEEKINPLGGCLPIAIQIPVFIALYWVLLYSVELRQAPFIFWIHDLSIKDPYFVLPVINGLAMLVQQRLNPSPMDPIQAKVMMILPLMFTFFFAFFPAGLVLYWIVNSGASIAQQWYITRWVVKA